VAVAHSLRVSIVVILIPVALTYGGFPLEAAAYRPDVPLDYSILAPWLAFGFVLGEVSERLRLQNGYLLAPIFFGAALTVSGIQLSTVPHWMTDFAQLMFGLVLGARYERAFFARYRLFIAFRAVELAFYRDRLGGGGRCPRLGFPSTYRHHDPRHLARRLGRNDDNRASIADQRTVGGRLPLVPSGGRQHGYPVYLQLRCMGVRREYGRLVNWVEKVQVRFTMQYRNRFDCIDC
jgi:Transition state regulatory protein AbrB